MAKECMYSVVGGTVFARRHIADGRSTRGEYRAEIKSCSKVARTENPSGKVTDGVSPGGDNIHETWETQFSPHLYRATVRCCAAFMIQGDCVCTYILPNRTDIG